MPGHRGIAVRACEQQEQQQGESLLQGALRNHASVLAETDVTMLHIPRAAFGPNLLSDEALRVLQAGRRRHVAATWPPRGRQDPPYFLGVTDQLWPFTCTHSDCHLGSPFRMPLRLSVVFLQLNSKFYRPTVTHVTHVTHVTQLNSKLYRPTDEMLRKRHSDEQSWRVAKHHYIREVIAERNDNRILNNRLSRNPNLLPATSLQGTSHLRKPPRTAWGGPK